jgi:hypothetical protein
MTPHKNVYEAWAAVMADVQAIGKNSINQSQNFSFRGVDDVMNAVGPAMREHGVMTIPHDPVVEHSDAGRSRSGNTMHRVTVVGRWSVASVTGDAFEMSAPGEALDAQDKATAKAMSVAFRTALLQALCIPTNEPDPDLGPEIGEKDAANLVLTSCGGDVEVAREEVQAAGLSWHDARGLVRLAGQINSRAVRTNTQEEK